MRNFHLGRLPITVINKVKIRSTCQNVTPNPFKLNNYVAISVLSVFFKN